MKKIFIIILSGTICIAGCSKKTAPTASTTVKKETTVIMPSLPAADTVKVNSRLNMALISTGQKVYENNCGKCHDLKKTTDFTQDRWVGIVRWMGPKAKLTEEEKTQVLAYVQHYAQDAPKSKDNM